MSWNRRAPFRLADVRSGSLVLRDGRWRVRLTDGFLFDRVFLRRRDARLWLSKMSALCEDGVAVADTPRTLHARAQAAWRLSRARQASAG